MVKPIALSQQASELPVHKRGVVITVPLQRLIEYMETNHLELIKAKPDFVLIVKTNPMSFSERLKAPNALNPA